MNRSLGFWKRFASCYTKVTQKTKRSTFHTKPKFWICAVSWSLISIKKWRWPNQKSIENSIVLSSSWNPLAVNSKQSSFSSSAVQNLDSMKIVRGWISSQLFELNSQEPKMKVPHILRARHLFCLEKSIQEARGKSADKNPPMKFKSAVWKKFIETENESPVLSQGSTPLLPYQVNSKDVRKVCREKSAAAMTN